MTEYFVGMVLCLLATTICTLIARHSDPSSKDGWRFAIFILLIVSMIPTINILVAVGALAFLVVMGLVWLVDFVVGD